MSVNSKLRDAIDEYVEEHAVDAGAEDERWRTRLAKDLQQVSKKVQQVETQMTREVTEVKHQMLEVNNQITEVKQMMKQMLTMLHPPLEATEVQISTNGDGIDPTRP